MKQAVKQIGSRWAMIVPSLIVVVAAHRLSEPQNKLHVIIIEWMLLGASLILINVYFMFLHKKAAEALANAEQNGQAKQEEGDAN